MQELEQVVRYFSEFPGLGKKSAARIAFRILSQEPQEVENFTQSIHKLVENVEFCPVCGSLKSKNEYCKFCDSSSRDNSQICVVEQPSDVIAIENTNEYNGLYHVLMGVLSPIDGFGPDDIRLNELSNRILNADNSIKEIVVATNPSIEGNATAHYILNMFDKVSSLKVTRIASGLAIGSQLEYADSRILSQSLRGRILLE